MQLGDRLRQAREDSRLSQVQVKEIIGINNKTLSNYENNVSSPDPITLKLLADLYGVSTDWLISGKHQSVKNDISDDDLELLRKLKKLSPERRKAIEILASDNEQSATADK